METQLTFLNKIYDILKCMCGRGASCDTPVYVKTCEQVDIEKSGWVCRNGTHQNLITTFVDGVKTGEEWIDSGLSCDQEFPVDVEIVQKERCDLNTNTIWKQSIYYAPSDPEDASTTVPVSVGLEYDTGIPCDNLLQDVPIEDCDGNQSLVKAVPVAVKGTSSVKECNSDDILAQSELTNTKLDTLIAETIANRPIDYNVKFDSIIAELQSIDGNTDGVEAELAAILADMQNLDREDDTQALADILARLGDVVDAVNAIEFDTAPVEVLLQSVIDEISDEGDETQAILADILLALAPVKYETTRTPFCTTDDPRLPKYLVGYSDGTTSIVDPVDGEDNWCECDC